jgi:hypothetical protein
MQFVLLTYIKLQLEMKMEPGVREKMVPGLYAIFDTTTPELRKMIVRAWMRVGGQCLDRCIEIMRSLESGRGHDRL